MDYYSLNETGPEEYNRLVKIALDYMLAFYKESMNPEEYMPLVRDHPEHYEEQLNMMQTYLNYFHAINPVGSEPFVLATMYVTQAAFKLGYMAANYKDPLPDVFKNITFDTEE